MTATQTHLNLFGILKLNFYEYEIVLNMPDYFMDRLPVLFTFK